MGGGPEHFVRNGLGEALRGNGHEVYLEVVNATGPFKAEIGTAFELHKLVADRVRVAVEQGRFPLVLSGNCNTSVGTITGLAPQELGIIWFDGHADFNTPETTTSGSLDGMGLAMGTGGCWKKMTQTIPGFRPIPEANVVLVGSRDIGQDELERLRRSDVTLVEVDVARQEGMREALGSTLDALHTRVRKVYVHLDLDVLDPEIAPANEFAPPNGLRPEELEEGLRTIEDRFILAGVGVASYDPDYDSENRMLGTGINLMEALTGYYSTDEK